MACNSMRAVSFYFLQRLTVRKGKSNRRYDAQIKRTLSFAWPTWRWTVSVYPSG